jgi:hypothetical protein
MRGSTLLSFLLIVALVGLCYGDACDLVPTTFLDWVGSPAQLKTCFDAIPLDEDVRTSTMEVVRNIMTIYPFADINQANIAPFDMQVRFFSITHGRTIVLTVYAPITCFSFFQPNFFYCT